MNEAETRAEHIDPMLKEAGWGVVEGSRIRREYPITPGRIEGHGRCGYRGLHHDRLRAVDARHHDLARGARVLDDLRRHAERSADGRDTLSRLITRDVVKRDMMRRDW